MNKRIVIKNKSRFIISITIVLLVITTIIASSVSFGQRNIELMSIEITRGDTLWSIAETYGDNKDIRKTIYDIKKLNKMTSSEIYEGNYIIVPVSSNLE